MDKKNLLLIGLLLTVSLAMLTAVLAMRPNAMKDEVIITVNGAEFARVFLAAPQDITIDQGDGRVNVVRVTEHGAVMLSSTCDNQICVHSGEVTPENWALRPNQQFIICLPNRVTVELAVKEIPTE